MSGYKDPRDETLKSGRSVADIVQRGALKGMRGVIVAPAGVDGRSTAFNPHDKASITINVEPDSPDGQALNLTKFTKESVRVAMELAAAKFPGNDINSVRERTAMAFEELARMENTGVVKKAVTPPPVPPAPVQTVAEAAVAAPVAPAPVLEQVDRTYSPMAAFGLKAAAHTAQAKASGVSRADRVVGPPSKLLYFEKEGIGTVPAFFHDVVIDVELDDDTDTEKGFIVLVYDLRYEQATARWFPPSNDPYRRPWALQINNDRRLYLVQTTGFQYVYDDREFCVLMVEKAVTAEG